MNVYIMQCDAKVQEEVCIHHKTELQTYLKNLEIKGLGGTDFRPVFERVEELQRSRGPAGSKRIAVFYRWTWRISKDHAGV
jgi:predicted metal-dependent peptidase